MSKYYNTFYKGSPTQFQIDLLNELLKDSFNIKKHRVLEIGSGNGFLLKHMRDNSIVCAGVENLEHLYQYSTSEGLKMYKSVYDVEYEKYSHLYMNNVVEHMKLEEMYFLLTNFKGVVIISTPDIRIDSCVLKLPQKNRTSFWDDYQHIKPYTPISLQRLLYDYGFKTLELERVRNIYGSKSQNFLLESFYSIIEKLTGIKHPFYLKAISE